MESRGGEVDRKLAAVAEEFWGSVERGADERHVHLPSKKPHFTVLEESDFERIARLGDESEREEARLKEQADYEERELIAQFSERVWRSRTV